MQGHSAVARADRRGQARSPSIVLQSKPLIGPAGPFLVLQQSVIIA